MQTMSVAGEEYTTLITTIAGALAARLECFSALESSSYNISVLPWFLQRLPKRYTVSRTIFYSLLLLISLLLPLLALLR
jgi:hypothetical protein